MFIKFVDIDWYWLIFVDADCDSYPCVNLESLSHVINQESHVYPRKLGKIYLFHFLKFWNLPSETRDISKSQKSELGNITPWFMPNFPLKHVITSTNIIANSSILDFWKDSEYTSAFGTAKCLRYGVYKKEAVSLFIAFVKTLCLFLFTLLKYSCFSKNRKFDFTFLASQLFNHSPINVHMPLCVGIIDIWMI